MSTAPRHLGRTSPAWLHWLPCLAWISFVVCLFRPGAPGFVWVGQLPGGDKPTHVLLIGTLAFLLDYALAGRRVRLCRCGVPLATLLVASFMTAEEVSQLWIPGRSFDWGDLVANYLGIATAWLASAWLFNGWRGRRRGQTI